MSYRTLKSTFHTENEAAAAALETARRTSGAAVAWHFHIGEKQMFCLITPELLRLCEQVGVLARRCENAWNSLPGKAQLAYVRHLIVEDIQSTNEIETVRSTRRELSAALDSLSSNFDKKQRFTSIVFLYQQLLDGKAQFPQSLTDIRQIYDQVTAGEIDQTDLPDGAMFRAKSVSLADGNKVVQMPLRTEADIEIALTEFLEQTRRDEVPAFVRAAAGHLIFEYSHPFYDGNGRTGRYLLAVALTEVVSPLSVLVLNRAIKEQKGAYYRAFTEVENPLNRGDITPFVLQIARLVYDSQLLLLDDLHSRTTQLTNLEIATKKLGADQVLEAADCELLYLVAQAHIFAGDGAISLTELATALNRSTASTRKRTKALLQESWLNEVSQRPLRFTLTPKSLEQFNLTAS